MEKQNLPTWIFNRHAHPSSDSVLPDNSSVQFAPGPIQYPHAGRIAATPDGVGHIRTEFEKQLAVTFRKETIETNTLSLTAPNGRTAAIKVSSTTGGNSVHTGLDKMKVENGGTGCPGVLPGENNRNASLR
jgi:hypothetical protein